MVVMAIFKIQNFTIDLYDEKNEFIGRLKAKYYYDKDRIYLKKVCDKTKEGIKLNQELRNKIKYYLLKEYYKEEC